MIRQYVKVAKISKNSKEFIFRGVCYFKRLKEHRLKKKNKPLSYTRSREIILKTFSEIGLKSVKFGLHSLRSGGATAAEKAGVKDRLFKRHGRWRSENAKDCYVKDNLKELLTVSRNLGVLIIYLRLRPSPVLSFVCLAMHTNNTLPASQ